MKRRFLRSIYVILCLSLLACNKDAKKVGKTLKASKMDFQYFKTKAKIKLNANGESVAATMNLRIHNGETIWMSVSKYGKEAMRAKVHPDSAHFLNKYPAAERYYKVFPTQEYLKKAGMDLDFKAVQNLMFGIHPVQIGKKDSVVVTEKMIFISQTRNGVKINAELDALNSKLSAVRIVSKSKMDTMNLDYKNYKTIDGNLIPTQFIMNVSNVQENERVRSKAEINFTSPKFTEEAPSFSFKVPAGYEKR